jgi:hypothetical protein
MLPIIPRSKVGDDLPTPTPNCTEARRLVGKPTLLHRIPPPTSMGAIMSDNTNPPPEVPGIKVAPGSSELAPFIYFDGVPTFGTHNGAIQIELAANTILPEGTGVRIAVVMTAHLRCSPVAAIGLRESLDKALELLQQGQQQIAQPAPGSKPH